MKEFFAKIFLLIATLIFFFSIFGFLPVYSNFITIFIGIVYIILT